MRAIESRLSQKTRTRIRTCIPLAGLLIALCVGLSAILNGTSPVTAHETNLSQQELAARRARIREYFQKRLQRLEIVATTVTPSGQTLDWILPQSQTADGTLAPPPPPLKEPLPANEYTDMVQTEVELYPHTRGPKGTVPIVRFDVERYLAVTPIPPADPKDVMRTMYPPSAASNGNYYVGWKQQVTNYGSGGLMSVWNVGGPVSPEASIAQVNVHGGSANANPPTLQTIEAGEIEKEPVTGDDRPHFFIYYTTSNYAGAGDWEGGYNNYVSGYIQYLFSRAPNMVLTSSVQGGRQVELYTTIRFFDGNWWISMGNRWIGYYPHCKGGMRPPCTDYPDPDNPTVMLPAGTLFAATGLRDSASGVDWYGEVHNPHMPTSTDMGSAVFASATPEDFMPAYFRTMTYKPEDHLSTSQPFNSGSLYLTDANCYNGSGPHYPTGPVTTTYPPGHWLNYFYYGGPGREARACR